jgi:thioredoxin reductase
VAELDARPFPPGEYPVVVVGSGPGGLQTSYCLKRLGIEHAVISQDDSPGGMFRKWPIYQRLLSWTKPDAPVERGTRAYEWYDHNSLLGEESGEQALVAEFMDRTWMVPSRPEMEQGLAAFADRAGVAVRYGCRWESTRREEDGFVLVTSDGEYRCQVAVFAIGVTEPLKMPIPGIEDVPHYVETGKPHEYEGKRVIVIGKRNSGFEIADGMVPWAKQVLLVSPRPVAADVLALSTVRVRYLQPYEDHSWGGGTFALDAAIERIEKTSSGYRIVANGTTHPGAMEIEADVAIAATGFCTPLRDLTDLGCSTVKQGVLAAQTHHWESATVPGIYFAGNATQAAAGLRKHGVGSASGTVSGSRYNARLLARHIAEKHFGHAAQRLALERDEVVPFLASELTRAPELWTQKSYLARVVGLDPDAGPTDEGIQPLAAFLDEGEGNALAVAVEMDDQARIYPALYLRSGGELHEDVCPPHPLHDFETEGYRAQLQGLVKRALG